MPCHFYIDTWIWFKYQLHPIFPVWPWYPLGCLPRQSQWALGKKPQGHRPTAFFSSLVPSKPPPSIACRKLPLGPAGGVHTT